MLKSFLRKMNKILISLALVGIIALSTAQNDSAPHFIESKLDGKVLTVTPDYAPPTGGPYQRLGVRALSVNSSLPQFWVFSPYDFDSSIGQYFSVNASNHNILTTALPCRSCFSYTYNFNITNVNREDGSRLIVRQGLDDALCVKNLGNEEFISEARCNESDISQLFFLRGFE